MKKKITIMLLALIMPILTLTGCSCNRSMWDTSYRFDKALVYEKGEWTEYVVTKWADYDNDMVCIWTSDGQMIYSSSNNIILYG